MTSDSVLFTSVDPVIEKWAEENSLKVFKAFADREARFVYVSNSDGECFQISIQPPQSNLVKVDAWTIETSDDREMHREWVTPISDLYGALQTSLDTVRSW